MSRHVFKKGINYFKKNGFKKACQRTVYFVMDRQSYGKLMKYTFPNKEELDKQKKLVFTNNPKISIIIPMYNTPVMFFKDLVDSIMEQTYSNWELCLADGTGKDNAAADMVKNLISENHYAAERIKYKMLTSNNGISCNTNSALEMATGEYIALVDHDDIITRDALYRVVEAINNNPLTDSIYSDEDKMDFEGKKYFEPHFKPDFNIDYLRNGNYICHLFVTKTEIAKGIGGFRKEFDGAQDFDFIFRCTEKSRHVAHIHRILYHWRCHPASTAARPESKMYAYEAGIKSIQEHYNRMGIKAEVVLGKSFGYYKSIFELSGTGAVTVVTAKGYDHDMIKNLTYCSLDIMEVEKFIPSCLNRAVRESKSEYILFLKPEIKKISSDVIENLLGYVQRDDVAAASARINDANGKIHHAGILVGVMGNLGYAFHGLDSDNNGYYMRLIYPQDVSALDMSCTLIKKDLILKTGGFDEQMDDWNIKYWSSDLCFKIEHEIGEKGKFVYNPNAVAVLDENIFTEYSWKNDEVQEANFKQKWETRIDLGDKYYNLNLTKEDTDFSIMRWAELKAKKSEL